MTTGPERITEALARARNEGRAALVPIVPLFDDWPQVRELVNHVVEAGADVIQFQLQWPGSPSRSPR